MDRHLATALEGERDLFDLFEHLARGAQRRGCVVDHARENGRHQRANPARRRPGRVGQRGDQRCGAFRRHLYLAGRLNLRRQVPRRRRCIGLVCARSDFGDGSAGGLGLGGDRKIHLPVGLVVLVVFVGDRFERRPRRRRPRTLDGCGDPTALLLAVDLDLRLDGQPRLSELVFGPQDLGLATNFGPLNRDRGVRVELGALALGAGPRVAVVGRLAAPRPQDERQQVHQHEECDRRQSQDQRPGAGEGQVIHGDPPRAEAVGVCIGKHSSPSLGDDLLLARNGGVQFGGLTSSSRQRRIELTLCVGEKLVGSPGFGTRTGVAGDPSLWALGAGVVFAASDDQRIVLTDAGLCDGVVECAAGIARLLQDGRRLRDCRHRIGGA